MNPSHHPESEGRRLNSGSSRDVSAHCAETEFLLDAAPGIGDLAVRSGRGHRALLYRDGKFAEALAFALERNVHLILPQQWQSAPDADIWLGWLENAQAPILETYVGSAEPPAVIKDAGSASECVRHWNQRIHSLTSESQAYDSHLVLEEVINNAILHGGFRRLGIQDDDWTRYQFGSTPVEIAAQFAFGHEWYGFSIRDNCGLLQPTTIMERLHRHMTNQGLLDESGRGLYLAHTLADRLFFEITPGRQTQVTALFTNSPQAVLNPKPLLIYANEVQGS